MTRCGRRAFTLIELLVVIAIIALLIAIIMLSLSSAKQTGIATKCLSQLRVLGQGKIMYSQNNEDVLVAGRLPRVDDCNWFATIAGGTKYRPTFLAMMGSNVGAVPFDSPSECRTVTDPFGE